MAFADALRRLATQFIGRGSSNNMTNSPLSRSLTNAVASTVNRPTNNTNSGSRPPSSGVNEIGTSRSDVGSQLGTVSSIGKGPIGRGGAGSVGGGFGNTPGNQGFTNTPSSTGSPNRGDVPTPQERANARDYYRRRRENPNIGKPEGWFA